MPRLFTALWPAAEAIASLDGELTECRDWPPDGWRAIPTHRWHLTLCFHGETDPGVLARQLDARASGLVAPWLRLAGAVSFPRVMAVGVRSAGDADVTALDALVTAAGADPDDYRAHVTVARSKGRRRASRADGPLREHRGPWWRPVEVCLVGSELRPGGPRYTVLHRVPLAASPDPEPTI